jgi:hypothetical protein
MKINKTNLPFFTTLLITLFTLSSCSYITKRIDSPADSSFTKTINSKTDYYAILDELGPPAYITSLADGFAFQYETLQVEEQQFGLSADVDLFRWFKLSYGRAKVDREVHTFVFNNAGYVQAYGKKQIRDDAGKGISYQFIVKVAQVVDTQYLEKASPQHNWGVALLQPLPVALNREQNLDSGLHGLEQRGTPTDIGQRTLEFDTLRKRR